MTVKMMICGRRRAGQTLSGHRHHMRNVHGKLVLDYIAAQPENAPHRYVQNHAVDCAFTSADPSENPFGLGFDFVTELWFPDIAAAKASRETPYYLEHLMPDEPRMVDTRRAIALPYAETPIKAPPQGHGAIKLFVVMGKDAVVPLEAVEEARADLSAALGHSRNLALVPGSIGAIDEFWLPDEEAAYRLEEASRKIILGSIGHDRAAAVAVVIAREFVLYAGQ